MSIECWKQKKSSDQFDFLLGLTSTGLYMLHTTWLLTEPMYDFSFRDVSKLKELMKPLVLFRVIGSLWWQVLFWIGAHVECWQCSSTQMPKKQTFAKKSSSCQFVQMPFLSWILPPFCLKSKSEMNISLLKSWKRHELIWELEIWFWLFAKVQRRFKPKALLFFLWSIQI